ncbi:MAG: hypothetical protein JNM63_17995 [Spirochaetia bacterium]|nr:hypothetical protein [Spirochaetia bacterium]
MSLVRHSFLYTWFPVRHSLRLAPGCEFACRYCPAGGLDYSPEAMEEEALGECLAPLPEGSLVGLGSGLTELYQARERMEGRTRLILRTLLERNLRPFILTKSVLVERDLDLFLKFPESSRPIIVMSASFADDATRKKYEPLSPSLTERLAVLSRLSAQGLRTGILMMPLIPELNDDPLGIESILEKAKFAGAAFAMLGFFEWAREGADSLFKDSPGIVDKLGSLRTDSGAAEKYRSEKTRVWSALLGKFSLLPFPDLVELKPNLSVRDSVVILLEQLYYLAKYAGRDRSAFRRAAVEINYKDEEVFEEWARGAKLKRIQGIGPYIEKAVEDLVIKGDLKTYEEAKARFLDGREETPTGDSERRSTKKYS